MSTPVPRRSSPEDHTPSGSELCGAGRRRRFPVGQQPALPSYRRCYISTVTGAPWGIGDARAGSVGCCDRGCTRAAKPVRVSLRRSRRSSGERRCWSPMLFHSPAPLTRPSPHVVPVHAYLCCRCRDACCWAPDRQRAYASTAEHGGIDSRRCRLCLCVVVSGHSQRLRIRRPGGIAGYLLYRRRYVEYVSLCPACWKASGFEGRWDCR